MDTQDIESMRKQNADLLLALRKFATAASPGPWEWGGTECTSQEQALEICKGNIEATAKPGTHFCEVFLGDGRRTALVGNGPTSIANAAFIAASNPAAILSLLDYIAALEADRTPAANAEGLLPKPTRPAPPMPTVKPPAPECSTLRRELGLAYSRTCLKCGLGPCREELKPAAEKADVLAAGCFGASCDTGAKTVTLRFDTFEAALAYYVTIGPNRPAAVGAGDMTEAQKRAASLFGCWWAMVQAERELAETPIDPEAVVLHFMGCGASCMVHAKDLTEISGLMESLLPARAAANGAGGQKGGA